jgi:leucyl/phenylalanyl-tRNA--protein transferase
MQLSAASGFAFVDCQLPNNHLMNLGATTLPRPEFLHMLKQQLKQPAPDWSGVQQQRFDCAQLLTNDPFSGLIKL